jgi:hypothetical protein
LTRLPMDWPRIVSSHQRTSPPRGRSSNTLRWTSRISSSEYVASHGVYPNPPPSCGGMRAQVERAQCRDSRRAGYGKQRGSVSLGRAEQDHSHNAGDG